jgi:hypothetical protein
MEAYLLPLMYWELLVSRTRGRRRKAKMVAALEAARAAFEAHPLTAELAPEVVSEANLLSGLESVGGRTCQDLSEGVLGGGGSQWLSLSDASQSSGAAQTPLQGLERHL